MMFQNHVLVLPLGQTGDFFETIFIGKAFNQSKKKDGNVHTFFFLRHKKMYGKIFLKVSTFQFTIYLIFFLQIEIVPYRKWKYRILYTTKLCCDLILLR